MDVLCSVEAPQVVLQPDSRILHARSPDVQRDGGVGGRIGAESRGLFGGYGELCCWECFEAARDVIPQLGLVKCFSPEPVWRMPSQAAAGWVHRWISYIPLHHDGVMSVSE